MNLLIFNLTTDLDHQTHGFTTTWINELAKRVQSVHVISMRVGRLEVLPNVTVYSVGKEKGYSPLRRIFRFYRLLFQVLRRNQIDACFAHMMPLFAVLGWPVLRLRNIPILLWYGHKATPFLLRIAHKLCSHVVTSSKQAFGLVSNKVTVIGQGIDVELFRPLDSQVAHTLQHSGDSRSSTERGRGNFLVKKYSVLQNAEVCAQPENPKDDFFTIVTVGRISPIKNLETLIEAVSMLQRELGIKNQEFGFVVRIIGNPGTSEQSSYLDMLRQKVADLKLKSVIRFEGVVPYERVYEVYAGALVSYNGCPTGAPDKAVLESMSAGVPPIVINETFREILGKEYEWLVQSSGKPEDIARCFLRVFNMSQSEREKMRSDLRNIVVAQHSVSALAEKIVAILQKLKTKD